MKQLRVLVAEDSPDDYLLIVHALERGGFQVASRCVDNAEDMRQALDEQRWDIILSDYSMPQFTAIDALSLQQHSAQSDLPFVIISGSIGEELAVAALKAGASNYMMKGNLDKLVPIVERELRDARVRRERAEAFVALEQAVRVRDEFLSIASHELKTPLTAVQLQLESVRDMVKRAPGQVDERLPARLDRAVRSSQRLGQLVASLLDVSRISTGRMRLNIESFDLVVTVREVAERLREQATAARSELRLRGTESLRGHWDRMRIEQVLMNLLSNAIKYGSGKPIELDLSGDGSTAKLRIIDHGIGVCEEDLERIFGRFERAVPSRHYGGLGLGLYLTRQIVAAHGGSVRAERTPGGGATFTVELPMASPIESPAPPISTVPPARRPVGAELRALIESVEDYAMFVLDPEGRIVHWNTGAEHITQFAASEVTGKHLSIFYTPEDVARDKPGRLLEVAARDGRAEDEGWRLRKDGTRFWGDAIITAVHDAKGNVVGFATVTRDLTHRKDAERQLARSSQQHAAVASLGSQALATRDATAVLDRAVHLVTAALGTELVAFLQLERDGSLTLRAGAGFKEDLVGRATLAVESGTILSQTLSTREPVVVPDVNTQRLSVPPLLQDHDVECSITVLVAGSEDDAPVGIFAACSAEPRSFTGNDVNFLQAVANVAGMAVACERREPQQR